MLYKIIFTSGYDDDIDSLSRELRGDILLIDEKNNYYNPQFITLNRIHGEFTLDKICYLEDNLVILHKITKDNILNCIKYLHEWQFFKRWIPLTSQQVEKYFFPVESWVTFNIEVQVKTVKADKNFDFSNIIKNISELANLKKVGSSVQFGGEYKIKDVELHIATPKGYDRKVLKGGEDEAKRQGVTLKYVEGKE